MSSGKRRHSVLEEHCAPNRFTITLSHKPSQERHEQPKQKKRKCQDQIEQAGMQSQTFPISIHTFNPHGTMDLHYKVEPEKKWREMKRYSSFVMNGVKYYPGNFVHVANECTIERQRVAMKGKDGLIRRSEIGWVAWILEIRAADEHNVYARVYWMYSPDELPSGTVCGKERIQGRQPYHGRNELIASNHMDIINVISVIEPVIVSQWLESDDGETKDTLYWRQTFNYPDSQLSPAKPVCKCKAPENPDRTLIRCTSTSCGKWMHQECLHHDVLMRVYNQLGTNEPQRSEPMAGPGDDNNSNTTDPLSSKGLEKEEMQPIIGEVDEEVLVQEATPGTPEAGDPRTTEFSTNAQAKPPANKRRKKSTDFEPYVGLFESTLKLDDGPIKWKIRDLREDISGGNKAWDEEAYCLLCGVIID
ncbi:hypothetical protein B0T10DRAFT_494175 [Thelonectria olida]|uniref:BAH domain-containing protein n=1 Tax=Thelonectria olida TaxID=1576542 RepID=A0A9P9AP39_9HYPO|nr:hypothetical protein B0T10DRAFT_494175 [Thelonectria olida]